MYFGENYSAVMKYRMITANRLDDGACVWMDRDGNWSTDIGNGKYGSEAETETLLKLAAVGVEKCLIVAPYAIDVEADGEVVPVRFREQVRAKGPTIPFGA
jgi:hypothetical protein